MVERVTTDLEVFEATAVPPQTTRAKLRGRLRPRRARRRAATTRSTGCTSSSTTRRSARCCARTRSAASTSGWTGSSSRCSDLGRTRRRRPDRSAPYSVAVLARPRRDPGPGRNDVRRLQGRALVAGAGDRAADPGRVQRHRTRTPGRGDGLGGARRGADDHLRDAAAGRRDPHGADLAGHGRRARRGRAGAHRLLARGRHRRVAGQGELLLQPDRDAPHRGGPRHGPVRRRCAASRSGRACSR